MRVPTRSDGTRSGVNWTRENEPPSTAAVVLIVSVFARPGTPSSSRCPCASRQTTTRSSITSWPAITGSKKVRNLERNPAASVVVDAREPGRDRWVAAAGTVEILRGDEARAINARIQSRYLTAEAIEDVRVGPVFAAGDDLTLRLTPRKWRSWTARGVDAQECGGIPGETPERWFLPPAR